MSIQTDQLIAAILFSICAIVNLAIAITTGSSACALTAILQGSFGFYFAHQYISGKKHNGS